MTEKLKQEIENLITEELMAHITEVAFLGAIPKEKGHHQGFYYKEVCRQNAKILKEKIIAILNLALSLQKKIIREDIVKIIQNSKATFFVKNKNIEIPTDELLYELKAEIYTNVENYFYHLNN